MESKTITSAELEKFLDSEECELLVGKKYEKYKHKWWLEWAKKEKEISLTGKKSWNWCAFLFSYFWFLYRKMYIEFAIMLSINVIQLFIVTFFFQDMLDAMLSGQGDFGVYSAISLFAWLGLMAIVGIYGNAWYLLRCLERAVAVKQNNQDNNSLERTGGTNIKGLLSYITPFAILGIISGVETIDAASTGVIDLVFMRNLNLISFVFNCAVLAYVYFGIIRKKF